MAQSPFKLFEPYSSNDKNIFFGRDAEVYALYNLLQQTRLVLIYGASGTGKTSLIHAGLPKVFKTTAWFRVSVRRKDNINQSLRQELARLTEQTQVTDIPTALTDLHEIRWIPIYLVFDQFEELFTLGNHEERVQFFTDLQTLLDTPLPCKIILSMREEYIGHLYEYEPFLPTLFDKRFRVEPMKDATVKAVINQMCAAGGVTLADGQTTADQIFEQVKEGKQAAHLPYLQVYLHYLYENAFQTLGKPLFTEGGITTVGQLGNVLKRFIETQLEAARLHFASLGLPDDFAARLLDEFATDEGTKQAHKTTDLAKRLDTEGGKVKAALHYFSEAKLLRPDEDDVERYEPVHDVVAKQIHELRSVEDKEFKVFVRQLQLAFEAWERDGKPTQRLLNELDLSKVAVYEERLKKLPNFEGQLVDLIDKSRERVAFLQRQERRRRNVLWGITVAALVGMVLAGWQYWVAQNMQTKMETAVFDKAAKEVIKNWGEKGNKNFDEIELLNLSGNALTRLPNEIRKCKNLKRLNLLWNSDDIDFNQVFESISKLNLSELKLSVNSLKDIPNQYFDRVTDLYILNGNLTNLSPEIGKLKNLKLLYLLSNKITSLPIEIGQLKNLLLLSVECSELTYIPNEIGQLKKLQKLSISNSKLTSLPSEIGQLKNLELLNLSGNFLYSERKLHNLPNEIGELENLQELLLHQNKLTSLPSEIRRLKNLKKLDLENNQFGKFPTEITELTNLQELILRQNKMESISSNISQMKNLRILDLSHNKLTSIPKEIGQMTNLESLNLGQSLIAYTQGEELNNNKLVSLPNEIGQLKNLQLLNVSNNKLVSLPNEIGQLKNLQLLDISQNQLQLLPSSFCIFKDMEKLDTENFDTEMAHKRGLSISDNPLKEIPDCLKKYVKLE